MSIRSFGLALLAACAFASLPGLASELVEAPLGSLTMEGNRGEKLTVSRKGERISQLRLEDAGGVWIVPAGALDIAFMPHVADTEFYHYDQRGKRGYYVRLTGSFVEGNRYERGRVGFEFLDGRLVSRDIYELNDGHFDLVKSEPF